MLDEVEEFAISDTRTDEVNLLCIHLAGATVRGELVG